MTEEQKKQMISRYPNELSKELAKEFRVSYHTVMKWAQKLGLKKAKDCKKHNSLSEEHEKVLREKYATSPMSELCDLMGKSAHTIQELARKRGIKRQVDDSRKGDLSPLFNGTTESFYWLGFIAADGYVSKTGHFMISQSEKDKENIYKLAEYLNGNVYEYTRDSGFKKNAKTYRLNICDKILGRKIYDLFGIKEGQKKTYTPLDLSFINTQTQAVAFLCGFMDGDGSRSKYNIRAECDRSQFDTFTQIEPMMPSDIKFNLSIRYRKDKQKSFCYISTNLGLVRHANEYGIGSTRKFSQDL